MEGGRSVRCSSSVTGVVMKRRRLESDPVEQSVGRAFAFQKRIRRRCKILPLPRLHIDDAPPKA